MLSVRQRRFSFSDFYKSRKITANNSTHNSNSFTFVQMADTQLGLQHNNAKWEEELELSRQAALHINRLNPKFAIVCGDLVNHMPELYPQQDAAIRTQQVADLKACFNKHLDKNIPLLCVCGNHDVGNSPTKATVDRYTADFGDDYYVFYIREHSFVGVVVNSSFYNDPTEDMPLFEEQQQWLEKTLQAIPADISMRVLFLHHPLFLKHPEEEDDDASLGTTTVFSDVIPNSYFHLPKEYRLPLLALLKKHGFHHIFSGHFHQNAIATASDYAIEQIVTSAVGLQLGSDTSGFRIVTCSNKNNLTHQYFSFQDLDKQAGKQVKEKSKI